MRSGKNTLVPEAEACEAQADNSSDII